MIVYIVQHQKVLIGSMLILDVLEDDEAEVQADQAAGAPVAEAGVGDESMLPRAGDADDHGGLAAGGSSESMNEEAP